MDRFVWCKDDSDCQQQICNRFGVALYDGEEKTAFEQGRLVLTSTKLIWIDALDQNCRLSLDLSLITNVEHKAKTFTKSAKLILFLAPFLRGKPSDSVMPSSNNNEVRLSFRQSGEDEFYHKLSVALSEKAWEKFSAIPGRKTRAGIVGIERRFEQEHKKVSGDIQLAFEDLTKLMEMAKKMVDLSKSIAEKIRSKQGAVTEDETVQFKSCLLSLGIEDPVTKATCGSGDAYFKQLAREICQVLEQPTQEAGGMIVLTDAYCRLNRARGFELVAPEDLLNACQMLNSHQLPLRFHVFESGVKVLLLFGCSLSDTLNETEDKVAECGCLTAEQLAQLLSIPVILAKERLLYAEQVGRVCRDESVEGLSFYPNYFLLPPPT